MARTDVTPQALTLAGLAPVMTAPAGTGAGSGDVVDYGRNILVVTNDDANPTIVTVETPETVDGDLEIEDRTVSVAAGATALIPLTSTHYRQLSGADAGRVYIDYSNVTAVTRAIVSF
jgi:hypothetical protein